MKVRDDAAQAVHADVGVDLRGGYIHVAEHLLHRPDVGAVLKHVSGKAVPEGVGVGEGAINPGLLAVFLNNLPNAVAPERPAVFR